MKTLLFIKLLLLLCIVIQEVGCDLITNRIQISEQSQRKN